LALELFAVCASARRMKPTILLCALMLPAVLGRCDVFMVAGRSVVLATPALYKRTYDEKGSGRKPLSVTVRETERADKTSVIIVEFRSGASVPSIMALVRACYDIAKERKQDYFINLKEWTDDQGRWCYVIGFANKKEPDPLTFFKVTGSEKTAEELSYMEVKEFSLIFEK
jgi:hypothetical protein